MSRPSWEREAYALVWFGVFGAWWLATGSALVALGVCVVALVLVFIYEVGRSATQPIPASGLGGGAEEQTE